MKHITSSFKRLIRMKVSIRLTVPLVLLIANAPHVSAQVRVASVFTDHMVLQRDRPIQIWGWADKGDEVISAPRETSDVELAHFEVADRSGNWRPAKAMIAGKTVVVASDAVAEPVAVRYAYAVSPENCNLYNLVGLPASPFCSEPRLLQYDPGLPQ